MKMHNTIRVSALIGMICLVFCSCQKEEKYDIIIRHVRIIDGSGNDSYSGEIGIRSDSIAFIGAKVDGRAYEEIEGNGLVAAPGFINMLSWATQTLIEDGRGMSDIKQGVTTEIMGEGFSMEPLSEKMKKEFQENQGDIKFDVEWTSLGDYLQYLQDRGVSPNVASFVGATTLRVHEIGYEDRPPTPAELERMKELADEAMKEGALGIGSSLIYAPAFYAQTPELIELCKIASAHNGSYITHMRSEGNRLLEAVDEVIEIASSANIHAEIYHLKAGGTSNWSKMDKVIAKIDSARALGINITTDMYNYIAGATGLNASMPPWVQEGGYDEWARRLKDPAIRKKVISEMKSDAQDWENLYYSAGGPENILLVGFKNDDLKKYTGKSLAEVSDDWGKSPEETVIELVIQDGSRVGTVYFLMSEENIKKQIQLPYMSFGSDAGAPAAEGVFVLSNPHPRAYGNFARLLGKYVREEKVISLENAIYKLTKLPATNLQLDRRGELKKGNYADIVLFDPETISDNATFDKPHKYATGMMYVIVNGEIVLKEGEHTGAKSGRFLKGPGFVGG